MWPAGLRKQGSTLKRYRGAGISRVRCGRRRPRVCVTALRHKPNREYKKSGVGSGHGRLATIFFPSKHFFFYFLREHKGRRTLYRVMRSRALPDTVQLIRVPFCIVRRFCAVGRFAQRTRNVDPAVFVKAGSCFKYPCRRRYRHSSGLLAFIYPFYLLSFACCNLSLLLFTLCLSEKVSSGALQTSEELRK